MIVSNLPTDFNIVTANPRRDSTRRGLKFIFDHLGPAREKFNNIITHTIQVSTQLCHGLATCSELSCSYNLSSYTKTSLIHH